MALGGCSVSARMYDYNIERAGRIIDTYLTPTSDIERAKVEAIDLLGLPPDISLVLRDERSIGR